MRRCADGVRSRSISGRTGSCCSSLSRCGHSARRRTSPRSCRRKYGCASDGADSFATAKRDPRLIKLLTRARRFNTTLVGSDGVPFAALAERESVSPSYFTRLVPLSDLASDIIEAILDGCQPRALAATRCWRSRVCRLPGTSSGPCSALPELQNFYASEITDHHHPKATCPRGSGAVAPARLARRRQRGQLASCAPFCATRCGRDDSRRGERAASVR